MQFQAAVQLATTTFNNIDFLITPPLIIAKTPIFKDSLVYAFTDISFRLSPTYKIYKDSEILAEIPPLKGVTSASSSTVPVTCVANNNIDLGNRPSLQASPAARRSSTESRRYRSRAASPWSTPRPRTTSSSP